MTFPVDGGPRFIARELDAFPMGDLEASRGGGHAVTARPVRRCGYCGAEHDRKRARYCGDACRRDARNERARKAQAAKPVKPRRCPYCMREHTERCRRYCCPEHAKRGAGHSAAASAARTRALKTGRARGQERARVDKAFRRLAMGDDSQLWTVIYNPVLRKRRQKLGLLGEPK